MREINLATIDEHAMELAEKYDLGIELDQFCTAMYMDPRSLKHGMQMHAGSFRVQEFFMDHLMRSVHVRSIRK